MGYSRVGLATIVGVLLVCVGHARAQVCPKSFKSFNATTFTNCTSLEALTATLSWTYNSTKGTVHVAFTAKPADSDGWVAWGINPTGTRMVGTQALLAFKHSNGTMVAQTYDVKSYKEVVASSNLSFAVTDLGSQMEDGKITIFAKVALPSKKSAVNHVWQVGPAVVDSKPGVHAFAAQNMKSYGSIDFAESSSNSSRSSSPSPSPEVSKNSTAPTSGAEASGISVGLKLMTLFSLGVFVSLS